MAIHSDVFTDEMTSRSPQSLQVPWTTPPAIHFPWSLRRCTKVKSDVSPLHFPWLTPAIISTLFYPANGLTLHTRTDERSHFGTLPPHKTTYPPWKLTLGIRRSPDLTTTLVMHQPLSQIKPFFSNRHVRTRMAVMNQIYKGRDSPP
jgi:hypothetical protein